VPNVVAIAADCPVPGAPVPVLPLDDVGAVADAALALAEPLAGVIAALAAAGPPARLMGAPPPARTRRP